MMFLATQNSTPLPPNTTGEGKKCADWCARHCIYPKGNVREKIRTGLCPCSCHSKEQQSDKGELNPAERIVELAEMKKSIATPTNNNGWEEELEKRMGDGTLFRTKMNYNNMTVQSVKVNELKSFITMLLDTERDKGRDNSIEAYKNGKEDGRTQTKEAILKLIEGMRPTKVFSDHGEGRCAALTDLASKIKDI